MSKTSTLRVLVVDDEIDHADVMAEAIARMPGYSVKQAHNLAEAKRALVEDETGFDLVVTDLRMDGPDDGFELLNYVRRSSQRVEVIVVTAHGDVSTAVRAMREGAYDFIQKPLDLEVIRAQVRRVSEKIRLTRRNAELAGALAPSDSIVGQSAPMVRVHQLIQSLAPTDISVLILGENGTGKELVARALHQNSKRASERFVALNCAGLNESTLEDELFGHVRGAFTDARGDREGRFEYADGGTLFLDEIGDMPLAFQAKLLRVLQDREITRLGSNEPIKVDVRFLAATNKDLSTALREKTFREDLFYRIKGAVIELPPLRNRREDIPLLINHMITRSAEKHGKKIEGIDSDAKAMLVAHPWPGNVRELESTLDYMVALAQGPRLTRADVPQGIAGEVPLAATSTAIVPVHLEGTPTTAITLAGMNLAQLERKAIEETLKAVNGNREQAAKILGIGERTLYRKISEYGL